MAIAKVVYKENASATPQVWMDTTQKTVTAGSMLSGTTALKNDGTGITGNIASKSSSDLTASGATVTAPAGFYAESASKTVASGSASTPATSITANPTISVNANTGLITASVSGSKSVTPTVSAGYVTSGTAGTVSVSGSNTSQLTAQAAQTIHPSTSDQTIASGKYLTGAQTVKGVLLTNLSAGNIKKDVVVKVGDSTDDDCVASVNGTYEGGGGGEIETGTYTPVSDISYPTITFAHAHSSRPVLVFFADATGTYDSTLQSNYIWKYGANYDAFGSAIYNSDSSTIYARADYMYRANSDTIVVSGSSSASSENDISSYVTASEFYPSTKSSTRYWRSGRTYKWIAVWKP